MSILLKIIRFNILACVLDQISRPADAIDWETCLRAQDIKIATLSMNWVARIDHIWDPVGAYTLTIRLWLIAGTPPHQAAPPFFKGLLGVIIEDPLVDKKGP